MTLQLGGILASIEQSLASGQANPARVASAKPRLAAVNAPMPANRVASGSARLGIFPTIEEAIAAAYAAFEQYRQCGPSQRQAIVAAMREAGRREAVRLAHDAHNETGLGRAEDKVVKNNLVVEKTPGTEDLEPETHTGENGITITEFAPYGVIGSITPTTNPTSTIINNSIAMLAAGNAVTFNVHPSAKMCSFDTIHILNQAVCQAGGPDNLITAVGEPTMESAKTLMNHPSIALLLVTGGPGVVAEALKSNKKAVTAGPGNPPAVVDETADIERAGKDIVRGASFDNNVICVDEKTTIAVTSIADQLLQSMQRHGAYLLPAEHLAKLEQGLFPKGMQSGKRNTVNPKWVGKNASWILSQIGVQVDESVKLVLIDVPNDHPLVWSEQLMPVMPFTRVANFEQAVDLAVKSEHGYRHTASIHTKNISNITTMAKAMNCSIFVANGPNFSGLGAGGSGFTSFSIASPTGEGLSRPRTFSRLRRIAIVGDLYIN